MPEYQSLLWPDAGPIQQGKKSKTPRMHLRGCEYCPQNEVRGIVKIKGKVEGKVIMVWAQSPGPKENSYEREVDGRLIRGKELIGPSGNWFWDRMAEVGIKRSDCDIQNVARCFPADWHNGRLVMRNPSKEELFCCSLYTDQAIQKSRAKVHIVLGQVAARQLFGAKFGGEKIFWSDKLNGRVVVLDHPAYFIRGYASESKLRNFRVGLQAAARFAKEKAGRFSYLEGQDYVGITTRSAAYKARDEIRSWAVKGIRITVDLETGKPLPGGSIRGLCYGFSGRRGSARVFLLDARTGCDVSGSERAAIREVVTELLEDETIKKTCHHGSFDIEETEKVLGCKLRGYDYDTNYAEYFAYPGRRSYALAEVVAVRYPDFAGFKEVVMPEAAPPGMSYDKAYKAGKLDFGAVPWNKLVLRNAADCDLTKRIEVSTKKLVSLPLLHVYMDAAFTLERMERSGPSFDYKQCDLLGEIYPVRLKRQREELQLMAGDPDFNPNTPAEVARVIYGKLGIEPLEGSVNTRKDTLEILAQHHPNQPFIPAEIAYRRDAKIESTYRLGFKRCADAHKGRLKTKWWLTGTSTGRISSGGSREGEEEITVNLQNVHGDPQLQNLLVADTGWRDIYKAWKEEAAVNDKWWEPFLDREVYLLLDYSQNELRFLAQSSGDPLLIEQFNSGADIHVEVGHEITGWDKQVIAKVKPKRVLIKNFHFGMIYGLQPEGMVDYLLAKGVKPELANLKAVTEMRERYFARYSRVKKLIDHLQWTAEHKGYVENVLGFRIPVDQEKKGGFWKNFAVNAPIQGGAHQLLLMALAMLTRKPKTYKTIYTPTAEIHDALNIPVTLRALFEAFKLARYLLEKEVLHVLEDDFKLKWKIPLKADAKAGFRYGVTVDIEPDMGMGTFMQNWCLANQKCQRELWAELKKVRAANPVT